MYDPIIGRFVSPDSMIPDTYNPQALNRYSYCLNNPLIYTDPTGHDVCDIFYCLPEVHSYAISIGKWLDELARVTNYSWNLLMLLAGPAIANAMPSTTGAVENTKTSPYDYLAEGVDGINFHGKKQNRDASKAYKDPEGRYTIYAEGNQYQIDDWAADPLTPDVLSPPDLADFMVNERGYDGGDILLVACNTGKGGKDSFAFKLRNILITDYKIKPMTITAPNDMIRIKRDYSQPGRPLTLYIDNGGELVDFPPKQ